jgi:CheY-like chemotaxis protein
MLIYTPLCRRFAMTDPYYIIVADNNPLRRSLLQLTIKDSYPSAYVFLVANGPAALQISEHSRADLIIAGKDVNLMDGLTLTRALRARGITAPVIITADDFSEEKEVKEAGATLLMSKTGIINELASVLPTLLPL